MLEITREDIAKLTDADLSGLVERLCEAELIKAGLPSAGLTLGGAQDATDGGVDLAVDTDPAIAASGYIPRAKTVIQVKATPMPPSKVVEEMRPKTRTEPDGVLRPAITTVLAAGGAYVIACSKTAPAGANLDRVRAKMAEAAAGAMVPDAIVDFLGPDRLALWCRSHPGVLSWARQAAGRPMEGWAPFENWSRPDEGAEPDFILDEEARLIDERTGQDGPLPLVEGVARMRALAAEPRTAVRLVGLSGVGKTRLIQALFDERVGPLPLPRGWALYCDAGASVTPDPVEMAKQLVTRPDRVVLIVDNCAPDLHRRLTAVIEARKSPVSLITVEYDVRDDDMEGTEVFRLEPASDNVTEHLIKRRYPHIRREDRRRIADMAGGNARVALALAHTVRRSDNLGRLRDEQLFERLFYQRAKTEGDLLTAAEIAALVYSFDGETLDGELVALAALAEQTVVRFRASTRELERRHLVQSRSQWRAILPHAVANRLAVRALERLDPEAIAEALDGQGERLLRSFSRRLSFLHDTAAARDLAAAWFAPDGRLGDVRRLDRFAYDMFRNLAPLAPAATLAAITRSAAVDPTWRGFEPGFGRRQNRDQLIALLKALAFDVELFDEAAERLVELALSDEDRPPKPTRPVLDRLFGLHASGTLAPPRQRLAFALKLVGSEQADRASLGIGLLDAMLETEWFRSPEGLDFGARPRGLGWEPTGDQAQVEWYAPVITALGRLAATDGPRTEEARGILAKRLRGLWWATGLTELVATVAADVAARQFWPQGWVAARMGLKFAPEGSDPAALVALADRLRPRDLVEKARTYGGIQRIDLDLDLDEVEEEDDDEPGDKVATYTLGLGRALAADAVARAAVLPELLTGGAQRPWWFGEGLARGAGDLRAVWDELVGALKALPIDRAEPAMLRAFLRTWAEDEPEVVEPIYDWILHDPQLGRWLPFMQTARTVFDAAAVGRVKASFALGYTTTWSYHVLQLGGTLDTVPGADFADILAGVAAMEDGAVLALHLFHMRTFSEAKKEKLDEAILQAGRDLLRNFPLEADHGNQDSNLSDLAELCLPGPHADLALRTLRRLRIAIDRYNGSSLHHDGLIANIFQCHPMTALDFFLGDPEALERRRGGRRLLYRLGYSRRPLSNLSSEDLLTWVNRDPGARHQRVAEHLPLFAGKEDDTVERWWPPALALLDDAPDPAPILEAYSDGLSPNSWSGSLADILERRLKALEQLDGHRSPQVRTWAKQSRAILTERIAADRSRGRERYQAFE
jgi:hypothetical protein